MAARPSDEVDDLEKELNSPNFDEFDSEAWDKRMSKVNKASSVLGTYLLQGWTMLGDHCEKCGSPLMGLRGAEPKCVVCTEANANANENENENETQAQTQTQTQTMSKMNGQTQERTPIQRQSSKQVSFGNGVSSNLKLNERGHNNKNNKNKKVNNAEEGNNLSIRYENIRTFGDILNKTSSSPLSGKNGASGYEEDIEDNITETQDIVDTTERKDNENVNKSGLKRRLQGSYGTHHHSHHNHHSFHHSRSSHGHGPSYYASHPSHANHRRERERDRNNINNYGASGYASHQNDLIFQSFDASISNILRKIDLLNEKMNKEDSIENIKQLQLCFECLDSIYKLQNRVNGSIYDSPCHATTNGSYYQLPYGPNHGPHYGPPRGPPYHGPHGPRGHHRPGRGRFHGYHQTTPSPHGAGGVGPLPHDAYGYY